MSQRGIKINPNYISTIWNDFYHESIPKQFLTTTDKRLQKGNRSNSTIFFPI